jgi:hypothetical protein
MDKMMNSIDAALVFWIICIATPSYSLSSGTTSHIKSRIDILSQKVLHGIRPRSWWSRIISVNPAKLSVMGDCATDCSRCAEVLLFGDGAR